MSFILGKNLSFPKYLLILNIIFMKKHTFFHFFCFVIFSLNLLNAQNLKKPNYITSGYYQLVYDADIAYLEGNYKLAFEKLQQAERCCPLINQQIYQEMELYCRLLMQNGQFVKAISYMDTLANKYGKFAANVLIDMGQNSVVQKKLLKQIPDFYTKQMPDLLYKSKAFYYSQQRDSIINILLEICADDQKVRTKMNKTDNNSENIKQILAEIKQQQQQDSINYCQIFELINTFDFPNTKLYGDANFKLSEGISALLMHFSNRENFPDTILQFVRKGKCEPFMYAAIIDRKMGFTTTGKVEFLYAAFSNATDDQIIDIQHLDERRLSIGMPTREQEKRRNELLKQRNE
jgi:hypothetical protein